MARQSISFTKPNDEWLKAQVDNDEYSSKSELINDLIRQTRKQQAQIDWIRAKLERSEKSGFTDDTKDQILKQSKSNGIVEIMAIVRRQDLMKILESL